MKPYAVNRIAKDNLNGFLFALPWIIGFLAFSVYPLLSSAYYSFTEFSPVKAPKWIGLENFEKLFKDPLFYISLSNTLFYTFVSSAVNIVVAFVLASTIRKKFRGQTVLRAIYFIPSIIPLVAATMVWIWMFDPQYGLIDKTLGLFGLYQPNWLIDPNYTKWSLILIGVWGTGTTMLIFLAALKDIPASYFEAAEIDGANAFQRLFFITIPSVSHVAVYQFILAVINGFQYFTQVYIITTAAGGNSAQASGGPENSILMYPLYLFHNAFVYLKMGKASAMAWILFIVVSVLTFVMIRASRNKVSYGAGGE